ncbi:2'-5' RNA ligase family protein [Acetobacter persici]|uniref:2'-5' RNA ligase family protein n=1 Tax=Acetobacter persici TaxID=1076596 RepID=UPI0036D760C2
MTSMRVDEGLTMYLIIGAALPAELRTTLLGLQAHFPDKSWVPESYLFLPFCTLGTVTHPGLLEEIDHALRNVCPRAPLSFTTDGFEVSLRKDRISLGIKIQPSQLDHLSVKIRAAMQRAGVQNPRAHNSLTIPLARITDVPPPTVSQWIQMHHPQTFSTGSISEITLFSSWKNEEIPLIIPEEEYHFNGSI